MTKFARLVGLWLVLAAGICSAATPPQLTSKELAQGYSDSIVLARPHASQAAAADTVEAGEGMTMLRHFPRFGGLRVLRLRAGQNVDQEIARLRASGRYDYVERDAVRYARTVPNDPSFGQQWSLHNTGQSGGTVGADIGAETAWSTLTDASSVIVAVIDTGARLTHTDLVANFWSSTDSGHVGTHGINSLVSSSGSSYYSPNDTDGHGTHVSGIIGAVGNNGNGISGVTWKTQLMELKFLGANGGTVDNEITCIEFAISHGAQVINASFGGGPESTSEYNAIAAARDAGIIMVVAAGNDSLNNDVVTDYPSGYALDNIVAVAATDRYDELDTSYSNYGPGSVELGAPGTDIYSTFNGSDNDYEILSGTSMATPHVVGAIALLRAKFPSDTYREIINRLLRGVTKLPSLNGKVQSGGRLNLASALASTTNRPFNDDFANRAALSGSTIHVRSNNVDATAEPGEPAHAGVTTTNSLWWTWTAPSATNVKIDTMGSAYDTVLAVYTGSTLGSLQSVASNDDAGGTVQSSVSFTSQAGTTYQIAVAGKGSASGFTALSITAPPGNDNFSAAQTVTGVSFAVNGSTLNASSETGEPNPTNAAAGDSVWYKWTAPASGSYTLSAFATQIDTIAAVYTGSSVSSLTTVAYDDNSAANPSNSDALLTFTASSGTTYYFQIDHNGDDGTTGGDFVLTLNDAAWEYPASDQVTSPPAVATDGTVYFGAGSTNGYDRKIYALTSTGTRKWTFTTLTSGDGILDSAPAIGADGTIYIGASDQIFYALNPSNGTKKWSFTATSALGSTAAIGTDGTIYFRDNTTLYALTDNGSSYTKQWSFPLTGSTSDGTYASPSIGPDGTIYIGTNSGAFYAINPNGSQKWNYTADGDIYTSPTIAADGTIYFATLNGTVYALSPSGSKNWSWTTSDNSSITSSIALGATGNLYFAGYDHKLHALSSSGGELWSYTLGDEVRACSPAIASDGTIYIGCYDGLIYAINSNGTLQRTYATAQSIRSSPVIVGQRLYIGSTDAKLYAFNLTPTALSGTWPMFHQNQFRTGLSANAGPVAPAITTQPASQTVTVGANVTFTVVATGTAPLTYQWQKGGVNISGATSTSLTLSSVTTADASTYAVVVTNSAGNVTSNAATLTVNKATATVTLGALAQTYNGSAHTVTAGTAPSGLNVTITYDGGSTLPVGAGNYSIVATVNDANYAGSASGTLVIAKAALTAQADDKTKTQGTANPTLTITYTGFAPGDSAASIDVPPVISTSATTSSPTGTYPITLTGGTDNNYTLTLVDGTLTITASPQPPTITDQPASQTVARNAGATFSIVATGTTSLSYQWQKNGAPINGANASSYTIASVQAGDAATYTVVVTNSAGSIVSSPAALILAADPDAPAISTQPQSSTAAAGGSLTLTVSATSGTGLTYQWQLNGASLAGATGTTLALDSLQPADAGIYTVSVTNAAGTTVTTPAIVGVTTTSRVVGDATVVGSNIVHPNGNIYDQVLLQGAAAAITALPGHVTRISFIDLSDNIVQVEFAGAGTLSLSLDDPSGPAAPVNYNQPGVLYMKGHARLVIVGADASTNVSVFSVGRATAFDPTSAYNFLLPPGPDNNPANNGSPLFVGHEATVYSGVAGIASLAIESSSGEFGGVRTADADYFASAGLTGVYAPGVEFVGPVYLGNVASYVIAVPEILIGSSADVRITGGDLFQDNGAVVQVSGITTLQFTDGEDSSGTVLPALNDRGVIEDNGQDVTSQIVEDPTP